METKLNERGITLVELLAALVLFGIIAVLVWKFFFQAINFSDREISRNQLQQEANLIVNTIQQVYTKENNFKLEATEDGLQIKSDKPPYIFENAKIIYNISSSNTLVSGDYHLVLKLKSKANEKISFETETTFSKLSAKPKNGS